MIVKKKLFCRNHKLYVFFHLTSSQILSFFHCFINAEIEADDSQELDLKNNYFNILLLFHCFQGHGLC